MVEIMQVLYLVGPMLEGSMLQLLLLLEDSKLQQADLQRLWQALVDLLPPLPFTQLQLALVF